MTLDLPSITVVTPSFNQGRFLERTILSVLDQAYPALEYFVMDGGSTDDSVDIIRRYAHRLDHWASQPDGGQTAAINTGWRMARGEILCWLNSDDYYLPGTLRFVGEYMREHPEEWVVYGSWEAVDDAGRRLNYAGRPFAHSRMILSQNCIPQPAAFIRREAIDEVVKRAEQMPVSGHAAASARCPALSPRALPVPSPPPSCPCARPFLAQSCS